MSCGVVRRRGSDPALLWLWRGPVATAPIGPLAWEPSYAVGAAQEIAKRQKKKVLADENTKPFEMRYGVWHFSKGLQGTLCREEPTLIMTRAMMGLGLRDI